MKLCDLMDMWKTDSALKIDDLIAESQRIYDLHSKYLDLWTRHRMILKITELEMKKLKLDKQEFLIQGPTKETKNVGWEYPTSGKVLRADIELYRDADKQMQELELKFEHQKVFVEALGYILQAIKDRNFIIGNAIKYEMFKGGA
jgi:hypothetical protein